jgi:hypothetical protein
MNLKHQPIWYRLVFLCVWRGGLDWVDETSSVNA